MAEEKNYLDMIAAGEYKDAIHKASSKLQALIAEKFTPGNRRRSGWAWVTEAGLLAVMIYLSAAFNFFPSYAISGSGAGDVAAAVYLFLFAVGGVNLIAVGVLLQNRADNLRGCSMLSKAVDFARRNLAVLGTVAASTAATGVVFTTDLRGLCFAFFALLLFSIFLVTIGVF
uniref:Uncharacterized protein n=1 Tax=Leersia perrieri TaxID=77586 RepID=A0A0D9X530_9ORYZ